jgi:hypothetical protein
MANIIRVHRRDMTRTLAQLRPALWAVLPSALQPALSFRDLAFPPER